MFPFLKHRFTVTMVLYFFGAVFISSCCTASYKCKGDSLSLRFRLLSSGGNDLLFGPEKIYDSRQVRFYSFKGTDTVFHACSPGPNPQSGRDSVLYLDIEPLEKLFVKWNETDYDSISLRLYKADASPCCPDFSSIESIRFNQSAELKEWNWGVFEFKK
jgi:hypothetical protein